jgi:hypothetical protein
MHRMPKEEEEENAKRFKSGAQSSGFLPPQKMIGLLKQMSVQNGIKVVIAIIA